MNKKILINISNHPSASWDDNQKKGWDKIIDVPFPNISADAKSSDVEDLAYDYLDKIKSICKQHNTNKIMLQGEFSFVFALQQLLLFDGEYDFYFPSTERKVTEKDGVKTSIFQFAGWRCFSSHYRAVLSLNPFLNRSKFSPSAC